MSDELYDVYVTVGDVNFTKVASMLASIQLAMLPDREATYADGHGRYNGAEEYSGVLLYLGLTSERAAELLDIARQAGFSHGQEAVGVAIIPANSALVYCHGRG